MGMDGHSSSATSTAGATQPVSQKLILLEAENRQLQAKLASLRNRLLDLMRTLSREAAIWITVIENLPA